MVYQYVADSDCFESLYPRVDDRDLLFFVTNTRRADGWVAPPVEADGSGAPPGDFPSLYTATPVFSQRAWDVLRSLIGGEVEALPLLHPRGPHYAINVLDVVDCLDLARTKLTRNDVTGRVSSIREWHFKEGCTQARHIFKVPQMMSVVLVSDDFRRAVEAAELKGLQLMPLT